MRGWYNIPFLGKFGLVLVLFTLGFGFSVLGISDFV